MGCCRDCKFWGRLPDDIAHRLKPGEAKDWGMCQNKEECELLIRANESQIKGREGTPILPYPTKTDKFTRCVFFC